MWTPHEEWGRTVWAQFSRQQSSASHASNWHARPVCAVSYTRSAASQVPACAAASQAVLASQHSEEVHSHATPAPAPAHAHVINPWSARRCFLPCGGGCTAA